MSSTSLLRVYMVYSQGTRNILLRQRAPPVRPSVPDPILESSLLTITTQAQPPNCLTGHKHWSCFLLPGAHTMPEQRLKDHSA